MAGTVNVLYVDDNEARHLDLRLKVEKANLPWFLTFACSLESALSKFENGQQFDLLIAENTVDCKVPLVKVLPNSPLFVLLTQNNGKRTRIMGEKVYEVKKDKQGKFLVKINNLLQKKNNNYGYSNGLASKKILIGEDNLMNTRLIMKMLEPWGLRPVILGNGQLILDELEKKNYDLLLIDLQMPVMDGIETIKHIRYDMKLDLKIVLMTAVLFEDSYTEILPLIQGMLPKPFTAENLFGHIKKCLGGGFSMKNKLWKNGQLLSKEKLYDLAFLRKTSRGNEEFVREMIGIFRNQVQVFCPQIPSLLETGNFDELCLHIHTIKSSARHVGSLELSQLCEDIEGSLTEKNLIGSAEIEKMFHEFKVLSLACSEQLRQTLLH